MKVSKSADLCGTLGVILLRALRSLRWGVLPGMLFALLPAGRAQATPTTPTPTIKLNSHLVVLDFSATDTQGKPVLDLRQDEVRVYESKRPQTVRSFDPPASHAMPPGSATEAVVRSTADLPKIGQAPVNVLVLDELNLGFQDEVYDHQKLQAWLESQPAVLANPAALMAVTYKDFEVLADYTQDRDALLKVLKAHVPIYPWRKDSNGSVGGAASDVLFETLGALEQIAQATAGIAGRKNLIWVGDGFPTLDESSVGNESSEKVRESLRRITNEFLKARVTLYIIGSALNVSLPEVVETQSDANAVSGGSVNPVNASNVQFASLAPPSGGRAYGNRNDLDKEIGESIRAGADFYTLSYVPVDTSDNPKEYRHIRVEITRPGVTVHTRDGYFSEPEKPAPPTRQELAFDLYGAAHSSLQYSGLHVTAKRVDSSHYALSVGAAQMKWFDKPDGKRHAETIVLVAYLSSGGRLLGKDVAIVGSETASPSSLNGAMATLETKVMPPPRTAHIRFVLRDANSGTLGTVDVTP